MSKTKEIIEHLIKENASTEIYTHKIINALNEILADIPKESTLQREAVKKSIKLWTDRTILYDYSVLRNIDKDIIDNLDYIYGAHYDDHHATLEIFIEFALQAYIELGHENTKEPKEYWNYKKLLTDEQLKKLGIRSSNEVLYKLREQLEDFGCDDTLSKYLMETISNKKRLPKEPEKIKWKNIELGEYILQKK